MDVVADRLALSKVRLRNGRFHEQDGVERPLHPDRHQFLEFARLQHSILPKTRPWIRTKSKHSGGAGKLKGTTNHEIRNVKGVLAFAAWIDRYIELAAAAISGARD